MNTPWGQADQVKHIIATGHDGIVWVSTPSHGGFHLSDAYRAAMPEALRVIPTFAGGNWYEEDCDAVIVILAFPAHFTAKQVNDADSFARMARGWWRNADAVVAYLDSDAQDAVLVRAHVQSDQIAKGEPL